MEPNKILSASILDLIFDDRNKEYGAYELRVTYPERVKKSLLFVFVFAGLALAGVALANKLKPEVRGDIQIDVVELSDLRPEEKQPEKIPEPIKKPEPQQVRTEQYTTPVIKDDKEVETPPPTQDELDNSKIDTEKRDGIDPNTIEAPVEMGKIAGIIEAPKETEPDIWPIVQVPAHFEGNWTRFLIAHLNAEVPVENGAPAGKYTVMIQFVVDKEGKLSDITPLTKLGYGMEQEAVRVLKKAIGWKPGIQNGREVKSYHKQPITFIVEEP